MRLRKFILGHTRTTGRIAGQITAALRVLGYLPRPNGRAESLEFALALGATTRREVMDLLRSADEFIADRIVSGRAFSAQKLQSVDRHLADRAHLLLQKERDWLRRLAESSFVFGSHVNGARRLVLASVAPSQAPPGAPAPGDLASAPVGGLVDDVAAALKDLHPKLVEIIERGNAADRIRLRQLTKRGDSSNDVFEVKNMLARLCSEKSFRLKNEI